MLEQIRKYFREPSREYGPTPFFALNFDLDPERLKWALTEVARAGMAGVFLHPRSGLEVEYLGEEFFSRIGVAIEACEQLGLKAWLYDEYNWPSGPASGKLLAGHPEYRQKYLDYLLIKKPKAGRPVRVPGQAAAVFAVGDYVDRVEGDFKSRVIELPAIRDQALIFFHAECRDRMFVNSCANWVKPEPGYLDLMNPDAAHEFIRLTHEQYAARFSKYFGNTVPGIFTDEPQHYNGFPWSDRFFKRFQDEYGYDPAGKLYLLILDREGHIKFRNDYYRLAERMMDEGFYLPLSRWCQSHNLVLTGHLGMEERITQAAVNHGGTYSHLGAMHMPGIDALGVGDGISGGLGNMEAPNFAVKMADSIAMHQGGKRVLCETGGGAGWQMTLYDYKRMCDWLFGLGVNFLNPHHTLPSTRGLRKRDFPPSHFWQEPWWGFYPEFSQYVSRVCWLLSRGRRLSEIAVLIPSSAFKALARGRGSNNREIQQLSWQIEELTRLLVQCQRDFDYLFEETISAGRVVLEAGKIVGAGQSYGLLVVPSAGVLDRDTLELIEKFLSQGGKVFFLGPLPSYNQEGEAAGQWQERVIAFKDRVKIFPEPTFSPGALAEALARVAPPKLHMAPGLSAGIILQSRKIGDDEVYFLANLSSSHLRVESLLATDKKGLEVLSPWSGAAKKIPFTHKGDALAFSIDFEPLESLALVASDLIRKSWVEETDLAVIEYDDEKFSGFYPLQGGRIKTAGEEQKLPSEPNAIKPINLDGPFEFEATPGNLYRLGPWKVKSEKIPALPLAGLKEEIYFPLQTRALIRLARPLVSLANAILRPESKYRELVYEGFGNLEQDMSRVSKVLGIDLTRLGFYQTIDLLFRFSEYLPLRDLFRVYPPPGSIYQAETQFFLEAVPEKLELIYEESNEPLMLRVNGSEIELKPDRERVWDDANLVLEIGQYIKHGKNRLQVTSRQHSYPCLFPSFHTLEPMVLRGNFELDKKKKIRAAQKSKACGDLCESGYPHFSGVVRYRAEFELDPKYLEYYLLLDCGEVREQLEVLVNDRSLGKRIGPPYQFALKDFVSAGRNRVEFLVSNTAANLLSLPQPSGLMGPVVIWPFGHFTKTRDITPVKTGN
jgi:hypothetical protein